jgi:surfeit locus 1 family protein
VAQLEDHYGGSPPLRRPGSDSAVSFRGVVAGLLVVAVAAVCSGFGMWQLDRLEQRRALNATLLAAIDEPFLMLDGATAARLAADPAAHQFRRVRLRGRFEPAQDVILRGRSYAGRPGVHLFTPVRLEADGQVVLVNRGWVAAPDAATIDPRAFARLGTIEVEGLVQPFPAAEGAGTPLRLDLDGYGVLSLARLDPTALRREGNPDLLPFYVQQLAADDPAGLPLALGVPEVSEGSHLSYAIQWFSFAAIFVIGFAVAVLQRTRAAGRPGDPSSD